MQDYYKKYKESKKIILAIITIYILTTIFLMLNINLRNEKIIDLEIEKDNLKEIAEIEKQERSELTSENRNN